MVYINWWQTGREIIRFEKSNSINNQLQLKIKMAILVGSSCGSALVSSVAIAQPALVQSVAIAQPALVSSVVEVLPTIQTVAVSRPLCARSAALLL